MDTVKSLINSARFGVNGLFVDKEPWQIVTITTSSVLLSIWFFEFIFQEESKPTLIVSKQHNYKCVSLF